MSLGLISALAAWLAAATALMAVLAQLHSRPVSPLLSSLEVPMQCPLDGHGQALTQPVKHAILGGGALHRLGLIIQPTNSMM